MRRISDLAAWSSSLLSCCPQIQAHRTLVDVQVVFGEIAAHRCCLQPRPGKSDVAVRS